MKHKNNHYGNSVIFGRKFNLQHFAEGGEGEGEGATGAGNGEGEGTGAGEGEKKYNDADVDKIVKERFARWQKDQERLLAEAKEEAAKLAKMNADQKQQYELEKLQKENAELKEATLRIELGKTATNLLREKDIEATENMLDFIVGKDADTTKANIDKFVKIIEAAVKKAEVERATGTTPRSYNNNGQPLSEFEKKLAKYQ